MMVKKVVTVLCTKAQKQTIQTLKRQLGWDEETYRHLIGEYSGGRTRSSRELTKAEACRMLGDLFPKDASRQAKQAALANRVLKVSCEVLFLNAGFDNKDPIEKEMNKAKLNMWLRQYGRVKKDYTRQTYEELKQTMAQLESIRRKGY